MGSEYSNGSFMSLFTLGRSPPFPSIYSEHKTPVTVDVLEVGWIVAFFTVFLCYLLLLPALTCKQRIGFFFRLTVTLFVGIVVILCNFGQEWETGEVKSSMQYKAGSHQEIDAVVGVKIGLRSVNITLKAIKAPQGDLAGEKIDYNERFSWTWAQGRAGFGPYAGRIQREFREAQLKGTPYPILWVAEYFTFDGEGLRLGRHYRHAGWYAHIGIWTAFPVWILTIILFKLVIIYGAFMLTILGALLLTPALIWCFFRNPNELAVIFHDKASGILKTHYGVHWYLALIVGILCMICGLIILVADRWFHHDICHFFGVNPFAILDENYDDDVDTTARTEEEGIELKDRSKLSSMKRTKSRVVYRARGTSKNDVLESEYTDIQYFDQQQDPTMAEGVYHHQLTPWADNEGYASNEGYFPTEQNYLLDTQQQDYHGGQHYPVAGAAAYQYDDAAIQQGGYIPNEQSEMSYTDMAPPRPPKLFSK